MSGDWDDFFVATAGAAAALSGLIIIAISVNIGAILKIRGMTSRAAATIASLILGLTSACVMLLPVASEVQAIPILVLTALTAVIVYRSTCIMINAREASGRILTWAKIALGVVQVLPFAAGAVLLLLGDHAGVGWIAAGILVVFVGSVTNAWVLLVEILR